MAAEIAASIATTIFDHSLGAIVRQFGYLWNHKKNMANLETQVKKLNDIREDNNHSVLVAQKNAERIRSRVESWQNDSEKINAEARSILEEYEDNANKRCLIGLCPNLVSHYQLSRKACKKEIEIIEALREEEQFKGVSERAVQRTISLLSTEGYFAFDSRMSTMEEIVKTLQDATKNSIGVYGFGGMGKTTLIKQVASQAAEKKMFDEIVMAPVTQTPDLKEIQGQIAKKLDLKLEESSVAERAGRICERLKEKKVLVILDDLWEKLDLGKVGIPFDAKHMGCKILLTSRFRSILSAMGTKSIFYLGALEDKEAWSLFEEKTKDVIKDPVFLNIGKEVAKKCAGLPVLIVTVAASLSSRPNLHAWKDALNQLTRMNNKEMHDFVHSAMEFISYKNLEETHKRLFLLCGLLGSGVSIADLLTYSLGWNLFDEDAWRVEDARNKLHALILDLKSSCLLLDGDNEDTIKIHDVVRGVAVSIARKDFNMFAVEDNDTELNRWPQEDVLKRCTAMVVHASHNLSFLPKRLECPLLELFIVRSSQHSSETISDTFFEIVRNLKVLDMSRLSFSTLPPSISFLGTLQTLLLDGCYELKDISVIEDLKKLQVLSFVGSKVEELPRGIGQLSELRLLDLSHCSKLNVIPAGLIEGLSRLEELNMCCSFNKWETEACLSSNGKGNVRLTELKDLPRLCSLEMEVPDVKLLSKDLNFEKLERYKIFVGNMEVEDIKTGLRNKGMSKKIDICLRKSSINHLQHWFMRLLKRTEFLSLRELEGIKNFIPELDSDGFPNLKQLDIRADDEIQYIINVEPKQQKAFPELKSLHLNNFLKLEKVCNGRLIKDSFGKLTNVNVLNCHKLESLFPFSLAKGLPCLEEIKISNCSTLKGIVAKKSREDDDNHTNDAGSETIEFVQLRKLSLECLPQLTNFYSGVKMLPTLKKRQELCTTRVESKEIIPEELESNSSLPFFQGVSFPRLEKLRLSEISNFTEIWSDKLPEKSCYLKSLEVEKCPHLVNIFSSNLLQLSKNLEVLHVKHCDLIEEVFVTPDELDIDKEHNGLVPQLIHLSLADLPKLRSMWSKYHPWILSFKNLKKLRVEKCSSLKYLFTPSITTGLVRLQELSIISCMMMKEIVAKEEGETTIDSIIFPQLSYLYLQDLPILTTFYSEGEEIGSNENIHTVTQSLFNEKVNFPSLKSLEIRNLDSIKTIWHDQPNEGDSFCKLEDVEVRKCAKLLKIFPSTVLSKIQSVKQIWILDCDTLDEVFDVQKGLNPKEITIVLQLRDLYLENLPKLRFVWKKDFHEILSFENLCEVDVRHCESLKHVFTVSVAQSLHQLQDLNIEDCKGLETIVDVDVDDENKAVVEEIKEEVSTTFIFPKVTELCLSELPKLECFYPRKHTLQWPELQQLEVKDCAKISILDLLNFTESQDQNQFEKVLSNLERLTMKSRDLKMMRKQYGHFPSELFPKLTGLSITEFHGDESAAFPSKFIYKLHNLTGIEVKNCSFREIFPYEEEGPPVLLPHLTTLQLSELPELKYIWKQDSPLITILEKLERLWVVKCPRLTNLVPTGSVSFKSLTRLTVEDCDGLINLIPSSTAASFEQLNWLKICGCQMIEEIVVADGGHDSEEAEIIFSNLWYLELGELPRLTSFCTTNYTSKFPKLRHVIVRQCPNVRTFSPGIIITPKLQEVSFGDEKHWNGDLNTTIQHLFSEMEVKRLTTTEPSISSNNPFESEAEIHERPTECLGKEAEEIREEFTEPRKKAEISENVIKPEYETEVREHVDEPREGVGIFEKWNEPRNGTDICEGGKGKEVEICEEKVVESAGNEGETWNRPCLESNISEKSHSYSQGHAGSSSRIMPFNLHGESSSPPISDPSSRNLANQPEERTTAKSLAQDHVASSSQLSPASDHLETSPSLVTAASNSQQKDFVGLRATKHFIPLLSKVLLILQTQPLNSMSAEHVQFMEDASRDLSNMNFPMEWLCPYIEKARRCLSVVERTKVISELELKMVEIEAQLQALEENKKALDEAKKALEEENEAIASGMDLNKPLYDD